MTSARRIDAIRGALLGTFVGDALGMPFEGSPPEAIPERVEMTEARLGSGTYTDDTQMMIALTESLLEHGTVEEDHLAVAFLSAYDPHRGYGAGTRAVFELWRAGVPTAQAAEQLFDGRGSLGNGAAMRVAPLAARFSDEPPRLREETERSARLTHHHPVAVDAAVVQVSAIAAAIRGDDEVEAARGAAHTAELARALDQVDVMRSHDSPPSEVAGTLGTAPTGHESVPAAIHAAGTGKSFRDAVTFAVRCGGDTDTIGAMTGAIVGARRGAHAIPSEWIESLEDGERGRTYVEQLAERLASDVRSRS
jgi:poly(ADP-ribose) glycohydrolase ARH3